MLPSLANSSGSALAQKPLWDTRSGQAYLGSESGWIRDGSLLVKPSRSAPLQQHCFLVIWAAGGWPQTAPSPASPPPSVSPRGRGCALLCRPPPDRLLWGVTPPSSPAIWAPLPPPGAPTSRVRASSHLPPSSPITSPWPLPSPVPSLSHREG